MSEDLERQSPPQDAKRKFSRGSERIVQEQLRRANASDNSAEQLKAITHASEGSAVDVVRELLSEFSKGLRTVNSNEIQRGFISGANRYMIGAEFAIVAIVAIAGIAKRRADLSYSGLWALDGDEQEVEKPAPIKKILYQAPRFKGDPSKFRHGSLKDVPDWMISLDGSVAAEAGYLYASVLRRPTILITMSDTFVSLAEFHFHDAALGWLIADLNKSKLKETWKGTKRVVAVSNGETIELPVWDECVQFYQNKPKNAEPDNLLTVVLKRNLDRELVEAALASVISPGNANIVDGARGGDEYSFKVTTGSISESQNRPNTLPSWQRIEQHLTAGHLVRQMQNLRWLRKYP